jgi:hypothetical protein
MVNKNAYRILVGKHVGSQLHASQKDNIKLDLRKVRYDILWWIELTCVSRVAQSVQCPATGWITGRSRFDPRQRRKYFSSSLCVQTSSVAHPASYTMGTGGLFPGVKCGRGVTLTTHPNLVPRSIMSRSYTSSHPRASVACNGTTLCLAFYS